MGVRHTFPSQYEARDALRFATVLSGHSILSSLEQLLRLKKKKKPTNPVLSLNFFKDFLKSSFRFVMKLRGRCRDFPPPRRPPPQAQPPPASAPLTTVGHLSQSTHLRQYVVIARSPCRTSGLTPGVVCSLGLGKRTVASIHCHNVTRRSFAALRTLGAPVFILPPPTTGLLPSLRFAFLRGLWSWNRPGWAFSWASLHLKVPPVSSGLGCSLLFSAE